MRNIKQQYPAGQYYPIEVDVTPGKNIDTELTNANMPPNAGIFVLPIDRCFGTADVILTWAANHSVPTFWPVTDWVKSTTYPCALGGYGVSQELCGYRMADKLAYIWSNNGAMPNPKFDDCRQYPIGNGGDLSWNASLNAFNKLGIQPPALLPPGLNVI